MCILDLSKVLMHEFHYDYIKNKYHNKSKLLFTDTYSSMHEIKTGNVYEDCSKEMFNFSNYSTKSKYYDNSNKLIIGEMKNKTGRVTIDEFVGLKPKLYLFLVDNSENYEYKDVLLNSKCIRHPMNRIWNTDHGIGTHGNNKVSLSCFDNKIYIQNNGYDGLVLGYQS